MHHRDVCANSSIAPFSSQVHDQQQQRRRLDARLPQFSHQQSKQAPGQNHQLLQQQQQQHENNVETQTQQLQHQQGISNSMGHLGGGGGGAAAAAHSSSMSQEDSSGHLRHDVAVSSVNMATVDSQELQKPVVAPIAKPQPHFGEAANAKGAEAVLLDERSLLACLVRAVPAEPSARISIRSTVSTFFLPSDSLSTLARRGRSSVENWSLTMMLSKEVVRLFQSIESLRFCFMNSILKLSHFAEHLFSAWKLAQLPNRLGKMLAPLHWHDYRKQYGRLDEFVGSHPEVRLALSFT